MILDHAGLCRSAEPNGHPGCRCTGTNGQHHNLDGTIDTASLGAYPADYGESCKVHLPGFRAVL